MLDKTEGKTLLCELFSHLDSAETGISFNLAGNQDEKVLIRETALYFRNRPAKAYFKNFEHFPCSRETADRAAAGDVTVVNIPWKFPEGKIDWHFNPTINTPPVNHEWLWQLNRMSFWNDLSAAYKETGDEKYAKAFNDQLNSWIAAAGTWEDNWNAPGSLWRTIETGLRLMYSWCIAFETFRHSSSFTDENICLMLGSMYRQAFHLQNNHRMTNNWLLMEMSGLYTFGTYFPEFTCSAAMRQYAAEKFAAAAMEQILPDGMHNELSPDYHSVLLSCAAAFCNIAAGEGGKSELPEEFFIKLELSYESALAMTAPDLTSPRTNDCFTLSVVKKMQQAVKIFPDNQAFIWAASERKQGTAPSDTPSCSRFLPWAGFAVMRSDWSADAACCCFDVGPPGMAHIHQDKLNINIFKGPDELIYDDGGGQYENSPWRIYAVSSAAHNTVLVDGLVQRRQQPRKAASPVDAHWISNREFDYACGIYDDEFGPISFAGADTDHPLLHPASHTREVRFFKPDFFCIKDSLRSLDGKKHSYEMRLHLDTLKLEPYSPLPGASLSNYGSVWDILIVPLFPEELEIRYLSGVDTVPMAGWFVGRNDKDLHKSTTVAMTVSDKADHTFATLLIPVRRNEILPEIEKRSANLFTLRLQGREYQVDLENLDV